MAPGSWCADAATVCPGKESALLVGWPSMVYRYPQTPSLCHSCLGTSTSLVTGSAFFQVLDAPHELGGWPLSAGLLVQQGVGLCLVVATL